MIEGFGDIFRNKNVLVTGHSGFKGSWLTLWLQHLGAKVTGCSIAPDAIPGLWQLIGDLPSEQDLRQDIRDKDSMRKLVVDAQPDFVFHLAAQAIVRESYRTPLETLETNVMGTANLLDALRLLEKPCSVVVVTSDKCYENINSVNGYREGDPMGGHDPYSMSKGAAELVVASWRRSFFADSQIRVASARAGNVIGGGDWAQDRIVTDCIASLMAKEPIGIRSPNATRPWQHVLEPLSGYLWLAAKLSGDEGHTFSSAWNFGPPFDSVCCVEKFVKIAINKWGSGSWEDLSDPTALHEAQLLSLNWEKSQHLLNWRPVWDLQTAIGMTVDWFKRWHQDGSNDSMRQLCIDQLHAFQSGAKKAEIEWASS